MGNIIASQLNLNADQSFAGAVIFGALAFLSVCATYAVFKNGFKKGFHKDDVAMGISAIGFTLMLLVDTYSIIDRTQTQAEAKIIDEDNKTYQIQYKDTIDRVPKSAVK